MTVQSQEANFEISEFEDLGMITRSKSVSLTIHCKVSGQASLEFTTEPSVPLSFTPAYQTPPIEAGETRVYVIGVLNLGTETTRDFILIATLKDRYGAFIENATSSGTILKKTGAPTYLNVVTMNEGKGVNNLPITIEYFDYTQTKSTGLQGSGEVQFDLETSADINAKVIFEGNQDYESASTTVTVIGGEEKTITFNLDKMGDSTENSNLEMVAMVLGLGAMVTILGVVYLLRKKS